MLAITGRLAGGWNTAWHGARTDAFSAGLVASAGVFAVPMEGDELAGAERRLAEAGQPALGERVVSGSPEAVVEALRGYALAGCEHLVLNFVPAPFRSLAAGLPARLAP